MERYNEYKDSSVQWLGEIPSHWDMLALKHILKLRKKLVGKQSYKYDLLSLTLQGIIKRDIDNPTGKFPSSFDTYQEVNAGDFVFCNFDNEETPRAVGLSEYKGMITGAYDVLSCKNSNLTNRYLIYYFLYIDDAKRFKPLYKGLRKTVPFDSFMSYKIPVPSIEEQQAIAFYLDTATAKIDEAIAQQQKMIDLLNERKQIIINNAVTKGLNPDAPMKDSGVEWIGEIPEHWIITKLKHLVEITDGTHDTPRYVDPSSNTYPLVTSRCIVNGVIDLSLANHITEQDYNYIATRSYVRRNDVIMPLIGTVGNPAIVDFEDSIAIKNVALFRTNGDINIAKFLKYLLNSSVVKEQFAMYNKGGVQNFVSQEILKNLAIIVPDNITDIVGFLEREIAKIETPIIAHNRQISLLQERKQIIINDVVTGKVKVS